MSLYPAFLKLSGRPVLLVGGGQVAAAKLRGLLEAKASVTVVAPRIGAELYQPRVRILRRAFEPDDVDGCWFVVAAATPEVNRQVAQIAHAQRIFVNAVDDAEAASAYLGGVVRKGGATVAISTGGRAPALAGLLREALEKLLPDELGLWLMSGEHLRARWRADGVPHAARRPLLLRALDELYPRSSP
ncbi:MAG TPA: bifunctional precorrin-2 dehydrogenase/sirohydrochlorin ferrochelatase [Myxococcaceae bacterium]|nr:bifunctional precorrin-2 dehydrogenase/sirohydrochlorin ferrochelatase [Myxococcaceae bacterium]